jgi:tetratricopeptide (TPR) repeat protein
MSRLDTIKKMLEESPKDSFLNFALAKEFEKTGNIESALNSYLQLYSLDPEYVGLYYHLGKLYEEFEEFEKALSIYDEGIALCKKISDFHALSELNNARTNCELEL